MTPTDDETLAVRAGTPRARSTGKEMKDPPPAIPLAMPAPSPAAMTTAARATPCSAAMGITTRYAVHRSGPLDL